MEDDPTVEPATLHAPIATTPYLRVVYSGAAALDRDIELDGTLEIGRSVDGAHALKLESDGRMSRQHAVITAKPSGKITLENKSQNGSFVNGARVDATASLADGDVIRLGDTFAILRLVPDAFAGAAAESPVPGLLGRAPAVQQLRRLLGIVGPTRASVVLLGETGTGKDVCARAIHAVSGRKGAFVAVNCAAIPENLAESQLFGHKAGAFTGAARDHVGVFQQADGGTLFLDEVGELQPTLQPKLLRALDEGTVFPVGGVQGVSVDVRVVCATNREIAREVERGAFRADLFARLAEITVNLPPLRARKEDVLLLLASALPGAALSAQLVNALLNHAWPFNVRELMKIATELSVKGQGREVLDVDLIEGRVLGPTAEPLSSPTGPNAAAPGPSAPIENTAKDVGPAPSKEELSALLAKHGGRVSDIARATGRSRTQVYRWLEEHALDLEQFRK